MRIKRTILSLGAVIVGLFVILTFWNDSKVHVNLGSYSELAAVQSSGLINSGPRLAELGSIIDAQDGTPAYADSQYGPFESQQELTLTPFTEVYSKILDELNVVGGSKIEILAELDATNKQLTEMSKQFLLGEISQETFSTKAIDFSATSVMSRYLDEEEFRKFLKLELARFEGWSEYWASVGEASRI